MYYEIIDNRKDEYILFLHCICGNNNIFLNQFEDLKKKYNFLLFDLPAHGKSLEYDEKFTFYSIADEILQIMLQHNINKVDIISISFGTMIADTLIQIAPDKIGKVIFTGAVHGFPLKFMDVCFLY